MRAEAWARSSDAVDADDAIDVWADWLPATPDAPANTIARPRSNRTSGHGRHTGHLFQQRRRRFSQLERTFVDNAQKL